MAYKPILFNTEMVKAIQDGRKTQTRRVCKGYGDCNPVQVGYHPPFNPGDILWVRETWAPFCLRKDTTNNKAVWCHSDFCYKASPDCMDEMGLGCKWHPSIHMPKHAARIFLRVKDVRVERLQDMRLEDCLAEGVRLTAGVENDLVRAPIRAREWFSQVWDTTIKSADRDKYGWDANPWVWVIEFERCEKPEGW